MSNFLKIVHFLDTSHSAPDFRLLASTILTADTVIDSTSAAVSAQYIHAGMELALPRATAAES